MLRVVPSDYFLDAPEDHSLTATQLEALAAFQDLLDQLQPENTRPLFTRAELDEKRLIMTVGHVREDFVVTLEVSDLELFVYWDELAHESLLVSDYPSTSEAIAEAVRLLRQALSDRLEVERTYRGETVVKSKTFRIDDGGKRELLATTGLFVFNPFAKKRVEKTVVSFKE